MFTILKREVKAYFQTVTGWLFIAAVLVLYGLYFLCLQSARRLSLYFLLTVGDRIYHADHGTYADYAQFCGGTPQQNRPVDP